MKIKNYILLNRIIIKSFWITCLLVLCLFHISCEKYDDFLDFKPDKKLVIPTSLQDCQALLDNYGQMNSGYPNYAEAVSDNIYLLDDGYNSQSVSNRDIYLWKADADPNFGDWQNTYQKILYANQVLETLSQITPSTGEQNTWNEIKGVALFFRAYTLFYAAQIWTKPYDQATSSQDLGMPIKLTTDLNENPGRGTVQQTYDRILQDMQEAVNLLPVTTALQSRPSKVAAYASLARIYLTMGDYTNAFNNADACLQRYNVLMDYNQLNANASIPFSKFNQEVIFASRSSGGAQLVLLPSRARVVPELYDTYEENDLRKTLFFCDQCRFDTQF